MILKQIYKILVLTGLMLIRMALKKTVNSNASTFTLVGECSGCFSLKHMSWSFQIIPKIRQCIASYIAALLTERCINVLALLIPGESMHEFGRRNLITALKLNDESKQGLPAASGALVSPVSLCTVAAPVPSFRGSWRASLIRRCHRIRLPAFIKISVGTINFSAILH